jgi:hypothetical protein
VPRVGAHVCGEPMFFLVFFIKKIACSSFCFFKFVAGQVAKLELGLSCLHDRTQAWPLFDLFL